MGEDQGVGVISVKFSVQMDKPSLALITAMLFSET